MNCIAFTDCTAILPDRLVEDATVVCQDGRITSIGHEIALPAGAERIGLQGKYLSPGFVDMHVHGGAGADFMDGTAHAVRTACAAHVRHGTTTIFPTTTTGSPRQIADMLEACREIATETSGPRIAGVHLYGPFFAADKVGCHSPDGRRSPSAQEYESYFASGMVRIATCAAELPGATDFYKRAAAEGCFLTCGHSNADWAEMQAAFDAGVRHVDHFWCAMSSVASLRQRFGVPMRAGMAEFVLMQPEMSTEVIADGCHLSPQLLEFAYRMLGPRRLCLVTDCNRALDMPAGEYRFGNAEDGTWLRSDGRVGWSSDGSSLASSIVGMDHMVRQMSDNTSASLPEVIRMASLTPAERVGIASQTGSIEERKAADLLVLSEDLQVERVFVGGTMVANVTGEGTPLTGSSP